MSTESADHTYGPEEAIAVSFSSSLHSMANLLESRTDIEERIASVIGTVCDTATIAAVQKLLETARKIAQQRKTRPKKKKPSKPRRPAVVPEEMGIHGVVGVPELADSYALHPLSEAIAEDHTIPPMEEPCAADEEPPHTDASYDLSGAFRVIPVIYPVPLDAEEKPK